MKTHVYLKLGTKYFAMGSRRFETKPNVNTGYVEFLTPGVPDFFRNFLSQNQLKTLRKLRSNKFIVQLFTARRSAVSQEITLSNDTFPSDIRPNATRVHKTTVRLNARMKT